MMSSDFEWTFIVTFDNGDRFTFGLDLGESAFEGLTRMREEEALTCANGVINEDKVELYGSLTSVGNSLVIETCTIIRPERVSGVYVIDNRKGR